MTVTSHGRALHWLAETGRRIRTRLATRRHLERIVRQQYDLICDLEERLRR